MSVRQWATELAATARGRHPKEPVMLLAERAAAIAEAILGQPPEEMPAKKLEDQPSSVPVKHPREWALRLLSDGPLKINDLQLALGHPHVGATKSLIKGLVAAKKVTYNEKNSEVKLIAEPEKI